MYDDSTRDLFSNQQESPKHLVGSYFALADWMKCCPRSKTLEAWSETLQAFVIIQLTCKNWGCPICGRRKVQKYAKKVTAAEPNRLITLTVNPKMHKTPREAFDQTRRMVAPLSAKVRRLFGEFEFFRILEVTKRGWPHYHLITRSEYIPQPELSRLWNEMTGAPIVDVRKLGKTVQAYWYVVKYLGKQDHVPWTDRRAAWTKKFFVDEEFTPGPGLGLMGQQFRGARPDNHARWMYPGCVLERYSADCWIVRGKRLEDGLMDDQSA